MVARTRGTSMRVAHGILVATLLSSGSSFAAADSTGKPASPRRGAAAVAAPAVTPEEPPPTCEEGAPVLASNPSLPSGCQKDIDCKGARICERHECVFPEDAAEQQPPPTAAPAPAAQPAPPAAEVQVANRPAPRAISAEECAPLAAAVLVSGTEVRAGPNATAAKVSTIAHLTPACVGTEKQGYRRVQLNDGTQGFVPASSIAD